MQGPAIPSHQARPAFDPSTLLELVADDRAFLDEFIVLFEKDAARLVLDVRAALAGGDGEALERAAHSLRGMLSHFGESNALKLSRDLESFGTTQDLASAEAIEPSLLGEIALIQQGLARLAL